LILETSSNARRFHRDYPDLVSEIRARYETRCLPDDLLIKGNFILMRKARRTNESSPRNSAYVGAASMHQPWVSGPDGKVPERGVSGDVVRDQ